MPSCAYAHSESQTVGASKKEKPSKFRHLTQTLMLSEGTGFRKIPESRNKRCLNVQLDNRVVHCQSSYFKIPKEANAALEYMFLSVISRFVCNRLNQSRSPSLLLLRSWDTKAEIKREMGTQRFVPPHKPLLVDRIKPSFVWCHILFMNFLIVSTLICQPNFPFLWIRISLKNNDTYCVYCVVTKSFLIRKSMESLRFFLRLSTSDTK